MDVNDLHACSLLVILYMIVMQHTSVILPFTRLAGDKPAIKVYDT